MNGRCPVCNSLLTVDSHDGVYEVRCTGIECDYHAPIMTVEKQIYSKQEGIDLIADYNGKEGVLVKLNEETLELAVAIHSGKIIHILEELADVQVVLEQIKALYELSDALIDEQMKQKIHRTIERLKL